MLTIFVGYQGESIRYIGGRRWLSLRLPWIELKSPELSAHILEKTKRILPVSSRGRLLVGAKRYRLSVLTTTWKKAVSTARTGSSSTTAAMGQGHCHRCFFHLQPRRNQRLGL